MAAKPQNSCDACSLPTYQINRTPNQPKLRKQQATLNRESCLCGTTMVTWEGVGCNCAVRSEKWSCFLSLQLSTLGVPIPNTAFCGWVYPATEGAKKDRPNFQFLLVSSIGKQ